MEKVRLGKVDYLNCLPIYQAIDNGQISLDAQIIQGHPEKLNEMFLRGELDITPISSIEYALNIDKSIILPDLSISADGYVQSILLFSKIPVTELEGKKVALTNSSATAVALLKILLEHYYHVNVEFMVEEPCSQRMLEKSDAALLIGDEALLYGYKLKENKTELTVTDLGAAWKEFTGEKMIYSLWVIRKTFAEENPQKVDEIYRALMLAKEWGNNNKETLLNIISKKYGLSTKFIHGYINTILYDFSEEYRRGLLTFYDYAYKSGLIEDRVQLEIWGETDYVENNEHFRKSS